MAAVVLLFFGTFVVGAFIFVLLDQAAGPMLDMAANSSTDPRLNTSITRAESGWDNWAWFVGALTALLGIAGAASASRRGI